MAAFEQLIERAKKTAGKFGGLLSLLLSVKRGKKIEFDQDRAAFIADGSRVSEALVQKELGRIELRIAALIFSYNEKLFKKEWTLAKWREEMDKLVEDSHLLFAGLALGGIAVAAADATVIRRIERDKTALKRFARAIRYKQVPSLPLANNRGRAYIRSFYVSFQLLNQKAKIDAGFTEAKRILTPAEHCHSELKPPYRDGCFEVAAQGWVDIRDMPPIGSLLCGQWCKCHLIYR